MFSGVYGVCGVCGVYVLFLMACMVFYGCLRLFVVALVFMAFSGV